MTTENQKPRILIAAIIFIAILLMFMWISGIFPKGMAIPRNSSINISPAFIDKNSSPSKLPPDIQNDIEQIARNYIFTINKWEFDPVKRDEIIFYAYDIRNESSIENLQGKQIGNYTLKIIHDTEFETTRSEVNEYLNGLGKNPDYQINSISMVTDRINDPPENHAELWVYKSTPENKKLDNAVIKGWKILVYPVSSPPYTTKTPKANSSGESS